MQFVWHLRVVCISHCLLDVTFLDIPPLDCPIVSKCIDGCVVMSPLQLWPDREGSVLLFIEGTASA